MSKKSSKREVVEELSLLHYGDGCITQTFYEDELYDVDFNENLRVSNEEYEDTIKELRNNILDNIETEKDVKVRVWFPTEENEEEYTSIVMTQGKLLTLLILAEPFHVNEVTFTDNFVFNVRDTSSINNYFDKIIKYFLFELDINISKTLMYTISKLSILSSMTLGSYAVTINLFDLCMLINNNKKFDKLIRFKLSNVKEKLDFKESMNLINDNFSQIMDILKKEDTCYRILLNSKAGINDRQLKDSIFLVGYKPDERGYIITEPADNSYIEGNDIIGFYIDAVGGRKALCINKKNTKSSGYLTRKLSLLTIDNYIDETVDDCGSKHYIEITIDCEKTLNRLNNRNYVVKTKSGKTKLKTINSQTDKHLIGKTLKFRSPITCALENGKICKACYGELWKYNFEKNVGLVGTLILTNQNTQLQLSAKHNLQANVNEIDWGEDFLRYFSVDKEQIFLNEEWQDTKLVVSVPEFIETDEFNDNNIFNTLIVEEPKKKDSVFINLPKNFVLNEDVVDFSFSNDKEVFILNLKNVGDEAIFTYSMQNNELSASLNNIINLIESHSYIKSHNISEITNRFIMLLNDSPLIVHAVHIEILLKELCVVEKNDRTLFKKKPKADDEYPDYPIIDTLRVTDAIVNSPSLAKSLVYQEQLRQFTQMPSTYYKKQTSTIDTLF